MGNIICDVNFKCYGNLTGRTSSRSQDFNITGDLNVELRLLCTDQDDIGEPNEMRKQKKHRKAELNISRKRKENSNLQRKGAITVDLVLQARAKLSDNKVNGHEDAIVSEMIEKLPLDKICTIARCFQERFLGLMESPNSWKIVKLACVRKPDAAPKKGIRSYRAIVLTSVMSKWYASCIVLLLEQEMEPAKWKNLLVGGMDGISCQHLQVLVSCLMRKTLGMARRIP